MKFSKYGLLALSAYLLSGCTGQPNIAYIDETEAFKYENKYLTEYNNLKANYENNKLIKWIQPANKQEECKVFVGVYKDDDYTLNSDYKIFWDGECKNGYAFGLGREFEKATLEDREAISVYSGMQKEPTTYYFKDNLNNLIIEGDSSTNHFVVTKIDDKNFDINIEFTSGYMNPRDDLEPKLAVVSTPFNDAVTYVKVYPNFGYRIVDFSKKEFDTREYEFSLIDDKNRANGYAFARLKNGQFVGGEYIDNGMVRRVFIPDSYRYKTNSLLSEIQDANKEALSAQSQAQVAKKQYKSRICKSSVKVNFINNEQYKEICNENKLFLNLKKKIDDKMAKIEQQKQAKRDHQYQERIMSAREMEAEAARRQASAAESANFQRSMQNFSQNMQMQQLNNKGLFKILCQSGKILTTQGLTHEDRSRRRAVCS